MKTYCPQCGHPNDSPTSKCEKCGVGFTVQINKGTDQHFLAYLLGIILVMILIFVYMTNNK